MKVAIVGGGIIGLASAWSLRQAGVDVALFDQGCPGRAASWAAGGMLAAHVENESRDPAFFRLARASQDQWPAFAHALRETTGIDPDLDQSGTVVVLFDIAEAEDWRARIAQTRETGVGRGLGWLGGQALRAAVPAVSLSAVGGVHSPRDGQVDPRLVSEGLVRAVRGAGVVLHEDIPVLAVETKGGRVTGLVTPNGRVAADAVVLTAGAWSGQIDGLPGGLRLPVRPVKGQMACIRWDGPTASALPAPVLRGPGIYAIPRRDGRLVLGATVEEAGFDPRLTPRAMAGLLSAATQMLPGVGDSALQEMWVGYRPATPDRLPLIGSYAGVQGLTVATGHYRNGILLAPVTADLVSDLVLGRTPRLDISAFAPDRFAPPAAPDPFAPFRRSLRVTRAPRPSVF